MKRFVKLLLIPLVLGLVVGGLSLPKQAVAACGSGYSYCITLTTNHAKVPNTDQTNFAALFATTTITSLKTTANGGHINNTTTFNGQTVPADFVISTASDCSALTSWDVESYVATSGAINVWIKFATLHTASDDVVYACYGNSSITTYQGGSVGAAWNSNFTGVWHLPNGTTLSGNDATSNGNNLLLAASPTAIAGQVDGAMNLDGATQFASTTSALMNSTNYTIESWAYASSTSGGQHNIFSNGLGHSAFYGAQLRRNSQFLEFQQHDSVTGDPTASGGTTITAGVWTQVVGVWDGTTLRLFVNGSQTATALSSSPDRRGTINSIGMDDNEGGFSPLGFWDGYLDEIKISNTNRAADWIATEYNNQSSNTTFWSASAEQSGTVAAATTATGTRETILNARESIVTGRLTIPGN